MPSPPSPDPALTGATASDVDAIAALERAALGPTGWPAAIVREEIEADRVVLVATADDELCGWIDVGVVGDVADLHRVSVAATARRRGVATALWLAARDEAERRGADRVLLEVEEDNAAARAAYVRWGFAIIARRRDYYGPGRDALVMQR